MILERLEPKKSTKVAVGAPGRLFKVAKGSFSARRLDGSISPSILQGKVIPFYLARRGSHKSPAAGAENRPLATLNGRPEAPNATFVDFLDSNRSRIIQFE